MRQRRNSRKAIGIIILAAGGSTRFGSPKQLFKYQGETLVRRAATTALNCDVGPVIVSVGASRESVESELADLAITSVFNSEWRSGMSSSLTTSLRYLTESDDLIEAVIFMLCDQPQITSDGLDRLIEGYRSTAAPIVAAEYSGTLGVPALFDRTMFRDLFDLSGDKGAKSVIKRHLDDVERVPMPEAAFDIDSISDIDGPNRTS